MLSDEEREALQYFNTETKTEAMHYGAVLVKLIEKQSKEIEELKEGYKIQEHNYQVAMEEIEQRCEDKIKAKIEWLTTNILENDYASDNDQDVAEYQVIILHSLLEKE